MYLNFSYDFQADTDKYVNFKTCSIKRNASTNEISYCITVICCGLPNYIALALHDLQHDLDQDVTQLSLRISYQLNRDPLVKLASSFCVEIQSSSEDKIILKGQKTYLEKVLIVLQKKQLKLQAKHQALNIATSVVSYPSE